MVDPTLLQVAGLDPQQIGLEVGGGAVIGGIIGFAAKKVAKIIAIIVGLELALFKFLETKGVLRVDWGAITGAASDGAGQAAEAPGLIISLLAALPVTAGFSGGFMVGFKKG
jgi:Uncharacterized conserved protein